MRILISFALMIISGSLFSCECKTLQPVSKELCGNYDAIFYGKVDSVGICRHNGASTAYFTIIELYKGSLEERVNVDFDCASSCLMDFSKGDEWLMYTSFQRFDLLTVKLCEHSRKLFSDESQDIYQLAAHRTFEEERTFLKTTLGIQKFAENNDLNEMHEQMGARNEQPSDRNKLWLLLISLSVMGLVYYLTRKKK